MQDRSCSQTTHVGAAMESGQWRPDILRHALDCEVCQDLWISACLCNYAEAEASRPLSANAEIVWWKGHLQHEHQRLKRPTVPIAAAQILAVLAGLVAVFVVAAPRASGVADPLVLASTIVAGLEALVSLLIAALLMIHASRMGRMIRKLTRHGGARHVHDENTFG